MNFLLAAPLLLPLSRCTDLTRDIVDWGIKFDTPITTYVDENGQFCFSYDEDDQADITCYSDDQMETEKQENHLQTFAFPEHDPKTLFVERSQRKSVFHFNTYESVKAKCQRNEQSRIKTATENEDSKPQLHPMEPPNDDHYSDVRRILRILNSSDVRLVGKPKTSVVLSMVTRHISALLETRETAPKPSVNHDILKHYPVSEASLQILGKNLEVQSGIRASFLLAKRINIVMGTDAERTMYADQAGIILAKWFTAILAYCGEEAIKVVKYDQKSGMLSVPKVRLQF